MTESPPDNASEPRPRRTPRTAEAKLAAGSITWLTSGALDRPIHLILAHGAGAGMASPVLTRMAALLDASGVTVHRFEFGYMARRTAGGGRRPAPRAETLINEYHAAVASCRSLIGSRPRLFIGGKSMGGRISCLAAAQCGDIEGVAILGFPLVPPGKPNSSSRSGVVEALTKPAIIVQGTRDAFGGPEAFSHVRVPACVQIHWIVDGDHDLKPRKASGLTHDDALRDAADALSRFCSGRSR